MLDHLLAKAATHTRRGFSLVPKHLSSEAAASPRGWPRRGRWRKSSTPSRLVNRRLRHKDQHISRDTLGCQGSFAALASRPRQEVADVAIAHDVVLAFDS